LPPFIAAWEQRIREQVLVETRADIFERVVETSRERASMEQPSRLLMVAEGQNLLEL
jgi:hypothetical protein